VDPHPLRPLLVAQLQTLWALPPVLPQLVEPIVTRNGNI